MVCLRGALSLKHNNTSNIYYKAPKHFYTCALGNCLHGVFAQYVGWEGELKEGRDVILSHGCPSSAAETTMDDG